MIFQPRSGNILVVLFLLICSLGVAGQAAAQDSSPPSSTIVSPVAGASGASFNISGTATDNVAVDRVVLSIRNRDTGQEWNGSALQAGLHGVVANGTANWSYSFAPPVPGNYRVASFAVDTSGNRQGSYNGVFFRVVGSDTTRPTSQISSPTAGSAQSANVTMTGTATDNAQIDRVMLSIRNLDSQQNWNGSGFQSGEFRVQASGTSNWSYSFSPGVPGNYRLAAFAVDTSGNIQNTYNGVRFVIQSSDTVRPVSTISSPAPGAAPGATVAMSGTATDNVLVDRVMLSIRNLDIGQNWNGSGYQSGEFRIQANGTANWSYNFTPTVAGNYRVAAFAVDSSGNVQDTYNGVRFVAGSVDNVVPTSTISSPTPSEFAGLSVAMTGTASDNTQVARVMLSIRNLDIGLNWTGSAFQAGERRVQATGTSNWSYTFTTPVAGRYRVAAFAVDTAGNIQNTYNGVIFTMGQTVRLMALGDSITEGVFGEQSYRKPLIDELNLVGCSYAMVGSRSENLTPTGFVSPHEGYSGHGVEYFLPGGPDPVNPGIDAIMMNNNADVILVHLGSNDMNRSQSIPGTITELDSLVTRIWNNNPNAQILVANVVPWFGSSPNPNIVANISTLGTQIQSWVAGEGDSRLHLVDVRSGFISSYMGSDGIHPNAIGDAHIADAFLTELNNIGVCR